MSHLGACSSSTKLSNRGLLLPPGRSGPAKASDSEGKGCGDLDAIMERVSDVENSADFRHANLLCLQLSDIMIKTKGLRNKKSAARVRVCKILYADSVKVPEVVEKLKRLIALCRVEAEAQVFYLPMTSIQVGMRRGSLESFPLHLGEFNWATSAADG